MSLEEDFTIGLYEAQSWLDRNRYEVVGEFDVERGYFWTALAAVQNGNPLYWDDELAQQLTGGPTASLTLLSAWFRPHYWMPGRTAYRCPGRHTST
ncbi:MAG: hypothetical protein R3E50_06410 [Halioglobus sp.]